eukprot:gnl/TRDRNA2_/TRDRNA2_175579_c7_seq27.p2 gnl/TRDRNA2_/TRDRNA2_175579_c7~~gnl/TRDRNA2_/TRDRNA2_175579_c7_seq27.p2  ORF type:complete len:116 (-),score=14.73 gnl/TRDRNA2_/TRDRNA2_175579_c7_seq27:816-1163(-)
MAGAQEEIPIEILTSYLDKCISQDTWWWKLSLLCNRRPQDPTCMMAFQTAYRQRKQKKMGERISLQEFRRGLQGIAPGTMVTPESLCATVPGLQRNQAARVMKNAEISAANESRM